MARCLIEPLSRGGEPCADVFRQGKQGAYRHQGEITIRLGLTSQNVEVCCLLRDPAMPTIGKNHPDPANAPTRPARADLKRLTEQRMGRVDNPDSRQQSFRCCGIAPCSASRPWPTPSSTASSTTRIACSSAVTACASRTRRKLPALDPLQPIMERSHPSSGRSATPADINRNGRPTSIGTGGRHQSECPADIIGIRSARQGE